MSRENRVIVGGVEKEEEGEVEEEPGGGGAGRRRRRRRRIFFMGVIRSGGVNCHVAIGGVEGSGRCGRGLRTDRVAREYTEFNDWRES